MKMRINDRVWNMCQLGLGVVVDALFEHELQPAHRSPKFLDFDTYISGYFKCCGKDLGIFSIWDGTTYTDVMIHIRSWTSF